MKNITLVSLLVLTFISNIYNGYSQTTIIASADAYTWDNYSNFNYGSVRLITSTDANTTTTTHNRNVYVKFDLSAVTAVVSAKLILTLESNIPTTLNYSAYLVSDSWTNNNIKWSNAPAVSGSVIASGAHAGNLIEFDLTTVISNHVASSDDTISIKVVSNDEDIASLIYSTDTASSDVEKPKLEIYETTLAVDTSINSDLNAVSIYPNPTNDIVFIKGIQKTDTTIQVYNTIGQLVKQEKYNNNLNLSTYKSGLYFVKISNIHGEKTIRIVKE